VTVSADAADPTPLAHGSAEGKAPGRVRGPYRTGIRQQERILRAATETFARRGYAGSSLRQIAAEVGVSPAAILMHFGSKEGLLMAVLDHWSKSTSESQKAVHGVAYLRALTDLMRRHLTERGLIGLFSTMATEAADPSHPAHELMLARYRAVEMRILEELGQARADGEIQQLEDRRLEVLARRIVAMMDGLQIQWLLNPELDLAGEFEDFMDTLIGRIR
jgi:AcrR family transcriptional regulator